MSVSLSTPSYSYGAVPVLTTQTQSNTHSFPGMAREQSPGESFGEKGWMNPLAFPLLSSDRHGSGGTQRGVELDT